MLQCVSLLRARSRRDALAACAGATRSTISLTGNALRAAAEMAAARSALSSIFDACDRVAYFTA
jgi:hypothetical protein